ncbi:MAG: hypothetical protein AAF668_08020 [Pseudomonadota bacterium]
MASSALTVATAMAAVTFVVTQATAFAVGVETVNANPGTLKDTASPKTIKVVVCGPFGKRYLSVGADYFIASAPERPSRPNDDLPNHSSCHALRCSSASDEIKKVKARA